jgi:hypothetical protein
MRFVVIQGVVVNTEAIDMIVPEGQQSHVFLRGGSERTFALTTEEILEHVRHEGDDVLRVTHNPEKEPKDPTDSKMSEESA